VTFSLAFRSGNTQSAATSGFALDLKYETTRFTASKGSLFEKLGIF
jgi:hypothetical protein